MHIKNLNEQLNAMGDQKKYQTAKSKADAKSTNDDHIQSLEQKLQMLEKPKWFQKKLESSSNELKSSISPQDKGSQRISPKANLRPRKFTMDPTHFQRQQILQQMINKVQLHEVIEHPKEVYNDPAIQIMSSRPISNKSRNVLNGGTNFLTVRTTSEVSKFKRQPRIIQNS